VSGLAALLSGFDELLLLHPANARTETAPVKMRVASNLLLTVRFPRACRIMFSSQLVKSPQGGCLSPFDTVVVTRRG